MAAPLDDTALFQHHDAIRIADGGQAVSDNKGGAAIHQAIHAPLHQCLGAGINGGGRLVQDQHRGICHSCPCNSQQLALSLREAGAISGKHGIIAIRQTADKAVCIGQAGSGNALLIRSIQPAVADILQHGPGEQMGVLQHDAQAAAQIVLFDLVDVDAVVTDLAVRDIIKTVDQVGNGGLARTGGAYKGDLLSGAAIQIDIVQNGLFRHIAKVHIRKGDVPLHLLIGGGPIVMGVLPGPEVGALLGLHQLLVRAILSVYQGHISLIGLRGLIHHLKDTLCTCKSHNDAVGLHGHLADGHIEALVQGEEGHYSAQGHPAQVAHSHSRTHQSADGIADISQLCIDRHHDVGVAVGLLCTLLQLIIQLAEAFQGLLLMGKDLDHLLAFHHFLDVAVDSSQVLLLLQEELSAHGSDLLGAEQHQGHHQQRDSRQGQAEHTHTGQHRNDGDHAGHQLRDALAQHLAQGVHVVGIHRHDIPVGMGVKITDRQALHVGEQLHPQVAQGALRYIDHDAGIEPSGQHAHSIDAAHPQQCPCQRPEIRVLLLGHGQDIIIHQGLQEQTGLHIGQRTDHDAHQHQDAVGQIMAEHLRHDPLQQLARIFYLGTGTACRTMCAGAVHDSCLCHYASPPCLSKSPPPWVWLL